SFSSRPPYECVATLSLGIYFYSRTTAGKRQSRLRSFRFLAARKQRELVHCGRTALFSTFPCVTGACAPFFSRCASLSFLISEASASVTYLNCCTRPGYCSEVNTRLRFGSKVTPT